jgi:hypothetical protein
VRLRSGPEDERAHKDHPDEEHELGDHPGVADDAPGRGEAEQDAGRERGEAERDAEQHGEHDEQLVGRGGEAGVAGRGRADVDREHRADVAEQAHPGDDVEGEQGPTGRRAQLQTCPQRSRRRGGDCGSGD